MRYNGFNYDMSCYRPASQTPETFSKFRNGRMPESKGQTVTFIEERQEEILGRIVTVKQYKVESYHFISRPVSQDYDEKHTHAVIVVPDDVYEMMCEARQRAWNEEFLDENSFVQELMKVDEMSATLGEEPRPATGEYTNWCDRKRALGFAQQNVANFKKLLGLE